MVVSVDSREAIGWDEEEGLRVELEGEGAVWIGLDITEVCRHCEWTGRIRV